MLVSKKITSILIICTGNICRSPMAEGVLRSKLNKSGLNHIQVDSAGTMGWDSYEPTSNAIKVCAEIGIDISLLKSAPVNYDIVKSADLILAMEKVHIQDIMNQFNFSKNKICLLGDFHPYNSGIEINDPYNMDTAYYRKILNSICLCMDQLIKHFH